MENDFFLMISARFWRCVVFLWCRTQFLLPIENLFSEISPKRWEMLTDHWAMRCNCYNKCWRKVGASGLMLVRCFGNMLFFCTRVDGDGEVAVGLWFWMLEKSMDLLFQFLEFVWTLLVRWFSCWSLSWDGVWMVFHDFVFSLFFWH